jgi:hypothetical protein
MRNVALKVSNRVSICQHLTDRSAAAVIMVEYRDTNVPQIKTNRII